MKIMSTKRKNIVVTMKKRLEALTRIDKGESLKNIAAEFGVGTSTISDWKKNNYTFITYHSIYFIFLSVSHKQNKSCNMYTNRRQ